MTVRRYYGQLSVAGSRVGAPTAVQIVRDVLGVGEGPVLFIAPPVNAYDEDPDRGAAIEGVGLASEPPVEEPPVHSRKITALQLWQDDEQGALVAMSEPTQALVETAELEAQAQRYSVDSKSANTWRACKSDLKHFGAWCDAHGLVSLPAEPDTVKLYLVDHGGLAPAANPPTCDDACGPPTDPVVSQDPIRARPTARQPWLRPAGSDRSP